MAPAESPCVCHLVARGGCRQGRACPVREIEMASTAALDPKADFPAPKGKKPMNNYRHTSSAWTGFAPRTTEQRWPTPPRTATFDGWFSRFIARLFGR